MADSRKFLRRLLAAFVGDSSSQRRRPLQSAPMLDALEERVVLSHFGHHLSARASRLAVAAIARSDSATTTNLTLTGGSAGACSGGVAGVQDAQLAAELKTLRTDVNSVLSGSTVTDAQRLALRTDLDTLADADFKFDKATLGPVVDSLLSTLADGTYDSDATVAAANKDAFTALFAGTTVSQDTIDKTYTDIVAIARNLNISTDELTTLSADRAAVQASLTRLGISTSKDVGQTNLDFILSPGGGGGFGRGFGGHRGRGRF